VNARLELERRHCERSKATQTPSFRDGLQDQTSDAQLRIGESRDSGFDAPHRPGMTESGFASRSFFAPTRWLAMMVWLFEN
jgi:hypothetical protein